MTTLKLGAQSKNAVDYLANQGLPMWEQPQANIPDMPADVTALSDEQLMDLFAQFTAWSDYVNCQVSAAQVDERAIEKRLSRHQNMLMIALSSVKGKTVTAIKAEIAVDDATIKIEDELEESYAYRKMVENIADNLERDSLLISRELTRRTNDFKARRKDKWSA